MRIRLLIPVLLFLAVGCGSPARVPLKPFYVPARVQTGETRVQLDIPYRDDASADASKHRLDLFLPATPDWPLLVFVHGGSLEKGDTAKRILGNDIYRNVGRFYSARGVGVALVNYRLQPTVRWPDQVEDIASATAWLLRRAREMGGDGRVYLSGHSAGSWLASRVALDAELHARFGFDGNDLAGMISISGSGFDLTDEETWDLFPRERIWQRRFTVESDDENWKRRASVVPLIGGDAPPFLLMYSKREWRALVRQNQLFREALEGAGVRVRLEAIDGLGHRRMLLALSHGERAVAQRVLQELGVAQQQEEPFASPSIGARASARNRP